MSLVIHFKKRTPEWLHRWTEKVGDEDRSSHREDEEHLLSDPNESSSFTPTSNSQWNDRGTLLSRLVVNLLLVLIALMAMIVLLLFEVYMKDTKCYGTYERGFDTDLVAAKSHIELKQVLFTGGIHFNPDGTVYIQDTPGPKYVGSPSPAIDEAWGNLLGAQIVNLPESQVPDIKDRTYFRPDYQAYETGLDAFHQLHCINQIRKAFHPEYYGPLDKSPHGAKVHIDHCLDYLRQSIQCSADMTPVILYYQPLINMSLPMFEQVHTCRNWDNIQNWADSALRASPRGNENEHGWHEHHQ